VLLFLLCSILNIFIFCTVGILFQGFKSVAVIARFFLVITNPAAVIWFIAKHLSAEILNGIVIPDRFSMFQFNISKRNISLTTCPYFTTVAYMKMYEGQQTEILAEIFMIFICIDNTNLRRSTDFQFGFQHNRLALNR
jgi:hypothetical protein